MRLFCTASLMTKLPVFERQLPGAAAPQFTAAPVGCELHVFSAVISDDVAAMVRALPGKQCSSDPLPTRLLKANVDILTPFLSHLFSTVLYRLE